MDEDRRKHLEFIQAVIARMAGNSFLLKGWTITLAAALFTLAVKDANRVFAVIALFPAVCFWGLDAYYLRQERLFRRLYDDVRMAGCEGRTEVEPFSLTTADCAKAVPSWWRALGASSVIGIHGPVVIAVFAAITLLSAFDG